MERLDEKRMCVHHRLLVCNGLMHQCLCDGACPCVCVESGLGARCGSEPVMNQASSDLSECQKRLAKLTLVVNC